MNQRNCSPLQTLCHSLFKLVNCVMYGMDDEFQILGVEEVESGKLKLMKETVNGGEITKMKDPLDCGWKKVTKKEIHLSCRNFWLYGSKEHVENLE